MTIQEAYFTFIRKLNRLSTNHRKNLPYPVFVDLFNEAQIKWATGILRLEEGTDELLENLEPLVTPFKSKPKKTEDYYFINLPEDYFHFKRSWSQAQQGECNQRLWNNLVESSNLGDFLKDPLMSPSFEWEETLAVIEGSKFKVYYDAFTISLIELVYYKVPPKVDIAGYESLTGPSKNIDPIFSDRATLGIIDTAVRLAASDIGDIDTYQLKSQSV